VAGKAPRHRAVPTRTLPAGVLRHLLPLCLLLILNLPASVAMAQSSQSSADRKILLPETGSPNRRTRLYLTDGSYQMVTRYEVRGDRVRYRSAEREDWEEVPTSMVDWNATHKWERDHAPGAEKAGRQVQLGPEMQKQEAEDAALMPEVATGLFLPADGGVFVLDTYQNTPQMVELTQSTGDLDRNTGHNILKAVINPLASPHQMMQLRGNRAQVQLHVAQPVFYISVGPDVPLDAAPGAFTVDTGAVAADGDAASNGSRKSQYVLVRASIHHDSRVIGSFKISLLGKVTRQQDVVEMQTGLLPGGHWMKLTPQEPLEIGEYALMEVLSEKDVNLDVWDFGVHPTAPENQDLVQPLKHRPAY